MPRLMSVTHTKPAVYDRIKTQTRRAGWTFLHPGDRLTLCEKVMGRRKGDPLVRICDVEVTGVRREPLGKITPEDVAAEGFPDWTPAQFIAFFCTEMGGGPDQDVTVVTWRYLDEVA